MSSQGVATVSTRQTIASLFYFFLLFFFFSRTGALLFLSHTPIVCAVCQQWSETSLLINMINKTQQNRRNWPDKPVLMLFLEADLKRLFCMVLLLVVFLPSRLKWEQTRCPLSSAGASPQRRCWDEVISRLCGMTGKDEQNSSTN